MCNSRRILPLFLMLVLFLSTQGGTIQAAPDDDRVFIAQIVVSPSEILAETDIQSVTSDYEGTLVTLEDLSTVVDRLNALYLEKGFITARAVLPAQTIEEGVVHITLVEGRVGQPMVEGHRYTRPTFITNRVRLKPGDLMNVAALEEDILLFNGTNDIQLTAQLQAGESFGTTDYILQVHEPPRWRAELSYSNSGRDEMGTNQTTLVATNRSVFGVSDPMTLSVLSGTGVVAGTLTYSVPVGTSGARAEMTYWTTQTRIIDGSFSGMQLEVESSRRSVLLNQPLVLRPELQVSLTFEHRWLNSTTSMGGTKLADTRGRVSTLGLQVQAQTGGRSFFFTPTVTEGTAETAVDENRFIKANFNFVGNGRLGSNHQLTVRLSGQFTGTRLLPESEEFTLGGQGTVRGFAPGTHTGPHGYAVNIEVRPPMWPLGGGVQPYGFADHGEAWSPSSGGKSNRRALTSLGIGADFTLFKNLSASLVYGVPVNPKSPAGDGGQLHFRATMRF